MPRRTGHSKGRSVPWWNDDIKELRRKCLKDRRTYQRKRRRMNEEHCTVYLRKWKESKISLSNAIKAAKEKTWQDLIASIDKDAWGMPNKIVMKRPRRQNPLQGIETPGRLEAIINELFPDRQPHCHAPALILVSETSTTITAFEIIEVAMSMPNRKAPGPDSIPNEVIKVAVASLTKRFQEVFTKCWS